MLIRACVCVHVCVRESKSDLKHRTWCVLFVNIQLKPQNIRLAWRVYTQTRFQYVLHLAMHASLCWGESFETCFADIQHGPFRGSTYFYSGTCCSFKTMRAFPPKKNPFSLCHEAHFTLRAEYTKVSASSRLQDGLPSLQGNKIYHNYGYLSACKYLFVFLQQSL